jgi:hypothetical protein
MSGFGGEAEVSHLFIDFLVERFGGRPYWDLVK